MKILSFIKWGSKSILENIKSWDRWMWAWFVTCAWGPTAFMDRETYPKSYELFIVFVFIFWIGYALIYTGIKRSYQKFQKEQQDLFDKINSSDVK